MDDCRSVTSFDGTRIAYRVRGAGGPTVVLSNGIGCDRVLFRYLARDLASGFRVIAWDYRGHGDSDPPADRECVSMADCALDLRAVLDDSETDRAVLVGYSMGAQLGFECYAHFPARVAALACVCGTFQHTVRTLRYVGPLVETALPLLRRAARDSPRLVRAIWRSAFLSPLAVPVADRLELFDAGRVDRSDFRRFRDHFADMDLALFAEMAGRMNEHSAASVLADVAVPTLIVSGGRDPFTPPDLGRRMAATIPDSEWELIPDATHAALLEQPERVNACVAEFIERRVAGGRPAMPKVERTARA